MDWSNVPPDDQCWDWPVFPGDWKRQDEAALIDGGWTDVPRNQQWPWSYVPYWTKPSWNPNIETSIDGTKQRAVRAGAQNSMRPMILPRDQNIPRTEYTKYVFYHSLKMSLAVRQGEKRGGGGSAYLMIESD